MLGTLCKIGVEFNRKIKESGHRVRPETEQLKPAAITYVGHFPRRSFNNNYLFSLASQSSHSQFLL